MKNISTGTGIALLLLQQVIGGSQLSAAPNPSKTGDEVTNFVRQVGWLGLGAQVPHDLGPVKSVSSMAGVHYAVTATGSVRRWGWNGGVATPVAPARTNIAAKEVWTSGSNTGWGSVIVQFDDDLFLGVSNHPYIEYPQKPFAIPGLAQLGFHRDSPVGRFNNGELRYLFATAIPPQDALIASDATDFASSGIFSAYRRSNGEIIALSGYHAANPVWGQWPPPYPFYPWLPETTKPRPTNWDGFTKFRPGFERIVALQSDGTLTGWGLNNFGQSDFPADLGPVSDFRCDDDYCGGTVILLQTGEVITWPTGSFYPGVPSDFGAARGFANGGTQCGVLLLTDAPRPSCHENLAGCCTEENPQMVNGEDLAALLAVWGPCNQTTPADFNSDGLVDGADLAALLNAWGLCRN
jgi:hypothetical protein